MGWIAQRLGCRGENLRDTKVRLSRHLAGADSHEKMGIGLTPDALNNFCKRADFDSLLRLCPWRGDHASLTRVAWWGSAWADLDPHRLARDRSMAEAAFFNVGVAVFDSLVDERSAALTDVAHALAPEYICRRVLDPEGPALRCQADSYQPVVELFDSLLSSAARRLGVGRRATLATLLRRMYLAETGASNEPFAAKQLPLVFIGELVTPDGDPAGRRFYSEVGRFVAYWDDWLDLADDLGRHDSNLLLGRSRLHPRVPSPAYAARAIGRLVAGRRFHQRDSGLLSAALEQAVHRCAELEATSRARALALLRLLVS